jgi:hypothetical protein
LNANGYTGNGRNEHTANGDTGNRHTRNGHTGNGHTGGNIEREKWEYWMGGLGLGPIRELLCDGREALFLAFLERFQCRNSCTANFLVM